ncbi:hypothetical protein R1sor_007441 [Riccia sorocarpa]|uniref:F-box domain-containing protein n=1 Tax=Riccia sorocarpa TaxID=122646 RepID=A0ABD3HU40_9MARC
MEEVTVLNRWNALPEECKSLILFKLSNKEIARIASVSKEFLTAVTALRGSVHLLVLPPTLSVSSLESMVAAYPNLKSLSFKRCGLKLKSFVSIIRAAAMGNSTKENINKLDYETLEKKQIRSLTYVDFKNCLHLLDTDVNLLCSLHTRLEEVDFTNCPCLSDTTLLTLSRYQHFEKPIDPLENVKCYPRFAANPVIKVLTDMTTSEEDVETEEMFLKNNDAAVYEEIQGLALNGTNHYRSWPRLGVSSDKVRRESMKVKVDDEKVGNSPYALRKNDSKAPAKKSYSQSTSETMLLKTTSANTISMDKERNSISSFPPPQSVPAVTSTSGKEKHTTPSIRSPRLVNLADQATHSASSIVNSTSSIQTTRPVNMDPNLTFIDWGDSASRVSAQVPRTTRSIEPPGSTKDAYDLSRPSDAETKVANKYHSMYQQYVQEAEEQSSVIMPALRDKMSLITAQLTGSSPVLTHEDEDAMRYTNIQTTLRDDRMTRTQTSVYYPKNSEQDSNSSSNTRKSSGLKSTLIAGATEIKDERLDLSNRANCNAEAFCRTENHVGIFTVSDLDARRKSGIPEIVTTSEVQDSRGRDSPSQLAICLPGSVVIGGKLRRQRHLSVVASESGRTCRHGSECTQDLEREPMNECSSETDGYQSKGTKGLKAVYIAGCPEITDRGVQVYLSVILFY